jgi:DUF1009 family protein
MTTADDSQAAASGESRIGVIAGSGALPVAIVTTLLRQGASPYVVLLEGEADDHPAYAASDHVRFRAEELGLLLPTLRKANVGRMVFAGGVGRRPRLTAIRWTWPVLRVLPRLAVALGSGDDKLLRTLVAFVEEHGISIVGAHEIAPSLLAPEGVLTRRGPVGADRRDIEAASAAAIAIGRLDIGQAAIAIGGRAVALEGVEGTDGLLARTAALRGHGRLAGKQRGVLAKRCKPQQELRVDLPAIGPDTVTGAHAAGLVGIAVEAGKTFILDYDRTIALADEHGMFVLGLKQESEIA